MKIWTTGFISTLTILGILSCNNNQISTPDDADLPTNRPPVAWSGTSREISDDQVYFGDLNITKAETNVYWKFAEQTAGIYDFEEVRNVVDILKNNGVDEISLALYPENALYNDVRITRSTVPRNERQWTAYKNFLTALVNDFKNDVQFYQIVREMNPARFLGTAEDYADFLVFSANIIKAVDASAKIAFAAMPYELCIGTDRENFIAEVIQHLPDNKNYFDAIDIHFHMLPQDMGVVLSVENGFEYVETAYEFFRDQLSDTRYTNVINFFETSSYSAEVGDINNTLVQTEEEQATDIEKRLSVLAQKGVYWINLEGGIYQRRYFMFDASGNINSSLRYFEHTGLIWNPEVNSGKEGTKKAYDTVKTWNH